MKRIVFLIGVTLAAAAVVFLAFSWRNRAAKNENGKQTPGVLKVAASIAPLGEFARAITGSEAAVSVIVPPGAEPHEYEPTPQNIAALHDADIVFVNGGGVDAWAEKIRGSLESAGVLTVSMDEALGKTTEEIDPHFWLDPTLVREEIVGMKNALQKTDPSSASVYENNADSFLHRLTELDREYREGLRSCRNTAIISSHNALGYLSKRYGFEAFSITGFSPESEPSARELAELASLAREKNIRFVFFESLVSPRLAQTLADEVGARTLVFHPLESFSADESRNREDYFSIMRQNLSQLRIALECL